MTEQIEPEKQDKPAVEGKYRYLADFSRQDSPNLRKLYRDSLSQKGNSNKRLSPSHLPSPYQSSQKRTTQLNRFSPSCSTFNPRREMTQQEFSPYDDRADRQEERLNKQLREENMHLRTQLVQANQIAESLRADLSRRQKEIVQLREANQADLCYFQKVVAEMTGEIQIVLTKNKILENQLTVAKCRLQQELRRQQDLAKMEEERRKHERRKEELSRDQKRLIGQVANFGQPYSRRSVGKLMSRPNPGQYEQKTVLGTSKIKIEEDLQNSYQGNEQKGYESALQPKVAENKEAKKGEELIESIRSMYFKIKGVQSSSLRQLWKWLKCLGHSQSCLKRWKGRAQAGTFLAVEHLRELIKQACSYIQ